MAGMGGGMSDELTLTEEQGIQAIIDLQGYADIEETRAQAKAGWAGMSESEKIQTERVHRMLFADKYSDDDKVPA